MPSKRVTPFPYTTLFRSEKAGEAGALELGELLFRAAFGEHNEVMFGVEQGKRLAHAGHQLDGVMENPVLFRGNPRFNVDDRSEEHTSELQSRENLVCRLL